MSPGVLVVEDDPHVRVMLDELLQDQGLDVLTVGDDRSAYRALGDNAGGFRVLLTDINLGGETDGFDVARRARSLNSNIAVIFITGNPNESSRFTKGDGVMLHKPLNLMALADMIQAAAHRPH
jgi:DNA-binding response OmpR family regulator